MSIRQISQLLWQYFFTLALFAFFLHSALSFPWFYDAQAKESINSYQYLPLILNGIPAENLPRINAPFFSSSIPFDQTAIAWFGYLSEDSNYTDIRVGYNPEEIYIYLAIFDRHLWYDETPTPGELTQWDAVSIFIHTSNQGDFSSNSWRFIAQLYGEENPMYRIAYRGSSEGWQQADVPFEAVRGWRGNALNDDTASDRGWAMGFTIPFSSLGFGSAPAQGSTWRLAVVVHDRDTLQGPPFTDQSWPQLIQITNPATWGRLHFGYPSYTTSATPTGSTTIRRLTSLDPSVIDADVGGSTANMCPGDEEHIWNEWANLNYGHSTNFNIQNQSDVADWPCFAKVYLTFFLDSIPRNKIIVSATLTLFQFGNAGGPGQAHPSWIQVLSAFSGWNEDSITWNNAPLAYENLGGSWVDPLNSFPGWPGVARTWDVTYALAQAYAQGIPLRLILYSADSQYHSGKYFSSSDTGDWNLEGRPRLDVSWAELP